MTQKDKTKNEGNILFIPDSKPYNEEESIERLTNFFYTLIEIDMDEKAKILKKGSQYCSVCKKEILELDDFWRRDKKIYCHKCLPRNINQNINEEE